jgi:hypothetical protein
VGAGRLYWADYNGNRIYWTSVTAGGVNTLPLNPLTLRAFALDLRPTKQHIYYIDGDTVWRSSLSGTGATPFPNPLVAGAIFGGLAIDTCSEQLIATISEVTPQPSAIVRADLATGGNVTTLLQSTPSVGLEARKIMLDLNARQMYWTVTHDSAGTSSVRRADMNGTNMQVLASSGAGTFSGMGLDLAQTNCTDTGINKDFPNNTGQAANDIEIVVEGTYNNVLHYDGYPANHFAPKRPTATGTPC